MDAIDAAPTELYSIFVSDAVNMPLLTELEYDINFANSLVPRLAGRVGLNIYTRIAESIANHEALICY